MIYRSYTTTYSWLWLSLMALIVALASVNAQANDKSYKQFGQTKIYYSSFNSSFILPSIASAYNISRGKDKGLVNISVIVDDNVGGITAETKGTVTNILGQQQKLVFFEVREGDSVYYLAPFKFDKEDYMTFKITVQPHSGKPAYSLSFQNKFYHDD